MFQRGDVVFVFSIAEPVAVYGLGYIFNHSEVVMLMRTLKIKLSPSHQPKFH